MGELNNNSHWAQTNERGSAWGILFLLYTFKFLGRTTCKIFMSPVLLYFYLFNRPARKNLLKYLNKLNNFSINVPNPSQWSVLKIFFNFGFGVVDRMSAWQGQVGQFKLTKVNNQVFLDLKNANKGAVIVVSHVGNFEISRMASKDNKNVKFNFFMHTKNAKKFTQVINKFNPEFSKSVIQGDELTMQVAIDLKEKVDAGEFVVIAGDRIPVKNERGVVTVDFLGEPAELPIGPYVLAKVLGCPLLGLYCLKQGQGYHVVFESYAQQVKFNHRNKADVLQQMAQKFASSLENQVKTAALQWYNFHDFWKDK